MKINPLLSSIALIGLMGAGSGAEEVDLSPEILKYEPFVWPSPIPDDCPFEPSEEFNAIKFLGIKSGYGDLTVNWPWMGPFVGFRHSSDRGHNWTRPPHTPGNPLFGENGINGYPVKIGAPHFVDFGKNMRHSPDGKAYLVAHGSDLNDKHWRFWNNSWINGDQVYLLRVTPTVENINDASKYEFYAGKDAGGGAIWTHDFKAIKPLLEWNNNMGCVTISYNAPLKKYLMCVTDGGNTVSKMNTYILEADQLEGEWKIISYMKDFGEQAYFVNIPTKFISEDGKTMWLLYSGNFSKDADGKRLEENPPGSHYGMVFQKIELLSNHPFSSAPQSDLPAD